jgi:hypothetical protein
MMARFRDTEMDARILALLAVKPMSDEELAIAVGTNRRGMNHFTRRLLAERRLHISGHFRTSQTGAARRVLAAGDGADAVFVPKEIRKPPQGDRRAARIARILSELATPGTSRELAARIGITQARTMYYLLRLREQKQARIAAWREPGHAGQWVPVYARGSDPDALSPALPPEWKRDRINDIEPVVRIETIQTIATARIKPQGIFAALGI